MNIPTIEGTIDRRLLVNYRVDPHYLEGLLPGPFRPKRIHGMGIAGICLIRLKQIRPRSVPALLGYPLRMLPIVSRSNGKRTVNIEKESIFRGEIPLRSSTTFIGGKLFPGLSSSRSFSGYRE